MSEALYKFGGLRFWNEREIMLREQATSRLADTVRRTLLGVNRAWAFQRIEGPLITPQAYISEAYTGDDIWMLQAGLGEGGASMRPETTASSYVAARRLLETHAEKLPLCVWQSGKSFRREQNDGASASKLRFYEFYQLEFQCIHAIDTKADLRTPIIAAIGNEIASIVNRPSRVVASDRLPAYSEITEDIEVERFNGRWTEMCSISTRTDFAGARVLEIAIGLDRLVSVCGETHP